MEDAYTVRFAAMNNRQLLAALRQKRASLAHNGRRSWSGRESRKEIAAAKAVLMARRIAVPPGDEPEENVTELLRLFPTKPSETET